jgi:uncharacterized repeat protein (TIGR01451 family)
MLFPVNADLRVNSHHKTVQSRPARFSIKALIGTALLGGGLLVWSPTAWAMTQAGTVIRNQAVGVFEDPDNGSQAPTISNEVTVTVAEITGITVANAGVIEAPGGVNNAGSAQGDGTIATGDVVYFLFTLTNVGNDPTQFFLPDTLSTLTGGTQAGSIQVIAYDADGAGPIAPTDLTASNSFVPAGGQTTGILLNGVIATNQGSVPMDGTMTVRVPIKVTATANQTVNATLGNTDARSETQNLPYQPAIPATDLYTVDSNGTIHSDTDGDPLNGDITNHRQEASTTQALNLLVTNTNLSGQVWKDDNFDGIRQVNETMLDGVTVELLDANGNSQGTRTTAAGGRYQFTNLPPGAYRAKFTLLPKYVLTLPDQGTDDQMDSDPKLVSNQTDPILVGNGAANDHIDAGMVLDSDTDTATDIREGTGDRDGDGISNHLDFDPTGYFYDEATGQIIPGGRITISGTGANQLRVPYDGSSGYYQWLGEVPGIYTMNITPPPGYALSDTCTLRPTTDIFDPTGGPDPTIIGTFQNGNTGYLINTTCVRSYVAFDLAPGDPVVINNNIPLKRLPPVTCTVGGGTADASITPYLSAEVRRDVAATRPLVNALDDNWRTAVGQPTDPVLEGWYGKSTAPSAGPTSFTYRDPLTATTTAVSVDVVQIPIGGSANCAGELRTAGSAPAISFSDTLQSSAPRPASLYNNTDQPGYWNETNAGATNDGKRNAVRFTFDQPIKAFGAWFGDLETRTDGNGPPAILRLLDAAGNRIGADIVIAPNTLYDAIAPDPETVNQSVCGGSANTEPGCGNQSTRWISFVDSSAVPRVKHVLVIVGDDDGAVGTNDGDSEHLSFIGANVPVATSPTVLLVKRITAINGTSMTDLVDMPLTQDDNHPNWLAGYLKGTINSTAVHPGDEIEYTIYFLSSGTAAARNVTICDRIPEKQTFVPTGFNTTPPAAGGLPTGDRGVVINLGGVVKAHTNIEDTDGVRYFPPGNEPSMVHPTLNCGGANTNGAVVVDLGTLSHVTAPGLPSNSYGYIRFRATVN